MNFGWVVSVFDVGDAFLTGERMTRKMYVRPPREGIPGVPEGAIIELLKGVFGLSESPRLWWLRFRQCVLAAGFIELKYAKAASVLYEDDDTICGLLAVHVDDGAWAGN